MRTRAEAAERLVLSGAIAAPALFAAYRSGEPAASGGVWDRAQRRAGARRGARRRTRASGRRSSPPTRRLRRAGCGWRSPRPTPTGWRRSTRPRSTPSRGGCSPSCCCWPARTPPRRAPPGRRPTNGWPRCWRSPGKARRRRPRPGTAPAAALAGLAATAPADDREAELAATLAEGRQGEAMLGGAGAGAGRPGRRSAGAPGRAPDAAAGRAGGGGARHRARDPARGAGRLMAGVAGWLERYLEAIQAERDAAKNTLLSYARDLNDFAGVPRRPRPRLRQRRPRRHRGLPRRPGRPRHGADDPGAAAQRDPAVLPLRLPGGLADRRPGGDDQGAAARADAAGQPRARARSTGCSRRPRRSGARRPSGCATSA